MLALPVCALLVGLVTPRLTGPRQTLQYGGVPHPLRLKSAISDLAKETDGGGSATPEQAAEMELMVQMLEEQNPSPAPCESAALMDGEWNQLYTSNAIGITYGDGNSMRRKLLGRLTGRVSQLISLEKGLYRQRIECWPVLRGQLRASFTVASPTTWDVSFRRFTLSALTLVPFRWRKAEYRGVWTHTYLDSDTRVMRTRREGGGGEFYFVLRRRRS